MLGEDPVFQVSEFVAVFNQSLDMMYPRVGIVGELANLRISRNQWVYFDLKDDDSSVKFFGSVRQLPGPLEDGLVLEVFGRPRLHQQYGFSMNIESLRPVGQGSIKKAQDLLARKLQAEGLFEPQRKRQLPYAPSTIGVITAEKSAAFADLRKIIDARWGNCKLQLIDVKVQGTESAANIIRAIQQFNELAEPPEVLVVIRGGGSAEDLASFSDEHVVRAVASSRIPTLVAIGHEVDISLAELAADQRASTPSNAAEMLVPDAVNEKTLFDMRRAQIVESMQLLFSDHEQAILDAKEQLNESTLEIYAKSQEQVERQKELLKLLDPHAPLSKGYALVRTANSKVVRSKKQLTSSEPISLTFADGTIKGKVE